MSAAEYWNESLGVAGGLPAVSNFTGNVAQSINSGVHSQSTGPASADGDLVQDPLSKRWSRMYNSGGDGLSVGTVSSAMPGNSVQTNASVGGQRCQSPSNQLSAPYGQSYGSPSGQGQMAPPVYPPTPNQIVQQPGQWGANNQTGSAYTSLGLGAPSSPVPPQQYSYQPQAQANGVGNKGNQGYYQSAGATPPDFQSSQNPPIVVDAPPAPASWFPSAIQHGTHQSGRRWGDDTTSMNGWNALNSR